MKLDEALDLLAQVCAGFRGTLQEHQAIQEALKVVTDKCTEINKYNVVDKCNELQHLSEQDEAPKEEEVSKKQTGTFLSPVGKQVAIKHSWLVVYQ